MHQFWDMIFNDTYRKYLEHQAVNHPALLHTEGSKVFEMIGIQDALGDFRSVGQEKGFIMRGIWYTYGFGFAHESVKRMMGGFIIAKHYSNRVGGKKSLFEAMRDSEKVADEIIAKMVKDSKNGHPLFYHSFNHPSRANVQPKFNAGEVGYSGYLVTFEISSHWNECAVLDVENWETPDGENWETPDGETWSFDAPAQWADGGLTPNEL